MTADGNHCTAVSEVVAVKDSRGSGHARRLPRFIAEKQPSKMRLPEADDRHCVQSTVLGAMGGFQVLRSRRTLVPTVWVQDAAPKRSLLTRFLAIASAASITFLTCSDVDNSPSTY